MAPQVLDPEERSRRSELAKQLHSEVIVDPETGEERRKFGGKQPGSGRPRKTRASTLVAEEARKHAEEIKDAFVDALQPHNHASVRVNAAVRWLEMEQKEEALAIAEERALEGMHRDALVSQLAEKLLSLHERNILPAGLLPAGQPDVIDA